eukprot:COSAG02_NODE_838_length_16633_cov_15.133724_2_plen_814_part_00
MLCADDGYATVSTVGCLVSPPPTHSTCSGFPTHSALAGGYSDAMVGTNEMPYFPNALSACAVVVGFTSFEEPSSVHGYSSAQSLYYDQVSGSVHHTLQDNSGQNPVSYDSCSAGNAELGFRTYYTHVNRIGSDGVADGDRVGVVGDSSTVLGSLGPRAAHGSQFFVLEDTDGFVHVHMDAVNVVDYTAVEMRGWVNVQKLDYDLCHQGGCAHPHRLKIWAEEAVDTDNPPAAVLPGGSVMVCALLRCGRQTNAGELLTCSEPERCASLSERHSVRCCSDVTKVGWKAPTGSCAVWTATNKVTGTCAGTITDFAGAEAHCASAGARLCTAEELSAGCTSGTGCSHDLTLVWTSSMSTTWSEVILLDGLQNDGADLMLDTWTQHRAPLQGFTEVSMRFGLTTTAPNEVWFDWFSVVGTGPDRSSGTCNAAVCSIGQSFEYSSCDGHSGQTDVEVLGDATACDTLNANDYSSLSAMVNNGWTTDLDAATMSNSWVALSCQEGSNWFGWSTGSVVGRLWYTMPAAGTGTVDFGNCWGDPGSVVLYVDDVEVARAGPNQNHVIADIVFQAGSTLAIQDEGFNSIAVLSSMDLSCGQEIVHDLVHWKVRPGGKCQSQSGWISGLGHSCLDHWTKQLCTQFGGYGPGWNASMGSFSDSAQGGVDATRACCECGGGVVDSNVYCKDCTAGWADFDSDPTTPCELCPEGASSMPGSTYCGTCPVGKFGQPGAVECLDCVAGQYDHDQDSATACVNCIGGRYSLPRTTACIDCLVGQFNMAGGPECVDCGVGTHDDDSDASTSCSPCPNGADKHVVLSVCLSV